MFVWFWAKTCRNTSCERMSNPSSAQPYTAPNRRVVVVMVVEMEGVQLVGYGN